MTKQTKEVKNLGGRPKTSAPPDPGKRVHLTAAVPQPLKQRLEEAAASRGWSVSLELTYRLQNSFDHQHQRLLHEMIELTWSKEHADLLVPPEGPVRINAAALATLIRKPKIGGKK